MEISRDSRFESYRLDYKKYFFLIYGINFRVLVFLLGSLITQSLGFYQEIVGQSPTLATTRNLTAR